MCRHTMKLSTVTLLITFLMLMASCEQRSGGGHNDGHDQVENSPNQALYQEVMQVHDEVMPKMNDLYNAKSALKKQLGEAGLSEGKKNEINGKIARIDSASDGMMIWMRQFSPIPDSAGEDKAKHYLQSELVKVKKVREDILRALETAP